tara:strand:+ start:1153 stop:1548 length:396 start_codon:yes stop_codon:yes gene_type:complete
MPEVREPVYKDIPLSFNAHPVTGNVKALVNREAVKQSVKNIVLTNFYERPYNPILGGDIIKQLFENMDSTTEYQISNNIREALENFEPRAEIDEIEVDAQEDLNELRVSIRFRIVNDTEPVTVDVFLERVR